MWNCDLSAIKIQLTISAALVGSALTCAAQTNELAQRIGSLEESLGNLDAKLSRQVNELFWFQRLQDIAQVDKVRFTGPALRPATNGLVVTSNEVIITAFSFLPRQMGAAGKLPLVVLAHPEIHGNVAGDEEPHVVRELVEQGYAVVAPDYRGSGGYGNEFWRLIDYGGLEVEDVDSARKWMLSRYSQLDSNRVAVIGWSHGGLIALLTVFGHPDAYQACYAGVPVSDLVERIRSKGVGYEQLFSAEYHIGKTLTNAPEEDRRRSPAWNAEKLHTPLLLHANTSDEDVGLQEIQNLISALQAAEKNFDYRIYTNAPGGHFFNRLDTPLARESRAEIWRFLARHLKPPNPVR